MHHRFVTWIFVGCCLAALARPALAYDVAIWASSSYKDDVLTKLDGTGLFDSVALYDCGSATPTLVELQQYHAVLVFSDGGFASATTMGDNLADYMDGGGGVVIATFAFWNANGLGIEGRIKTDGYLPFTTDGQSGGSGLTLVPIVANHELLDSVASFNGGSAGYHNASISTVAGATEVAQWSNGQPLVAAYEPTGGLIVGLNFYPPSSDIRSDFWDASTDGATLMSNALMFAAGGADSDGDGWSEGDGDCDDTDPNVYPGAPEICDDGIDQNCDGVMNETVDNDGDGFSQCDGDCDDANLTVCPGCP